MIRFSFAIAGLALVLTGAGCAAVPAQDATMRAAYGEAVTLGVGQLVEYEDGLHVTLLQISDSRCPEDVQCFWQGELSGRFGLSGGSVSGAEEVYLGMVTSPVATVDGYEILLTGATELNVTLMVLKE